MEYVVFALVMLFPLAVCVVAVGTIGGTRAPRRLVARLLVVAATALSYLAIFPVAWPGDPLFEGELSSASPLTLPPAQTWLGRVLVFSGELSQGQKQDDYAVDVLAVGGTSPLLSLNGQLEVHQERRKIGRGARKTINVAHLTRNHELPPSTAEQSLVLRLIKGNPMHVAVRAGEVPARYPLGLGLVIGAMAGLAEEVTTRSSRREQARDGKRSKQLPRSTSAIATLGVFASVLTEGAHPPVLGGVVVFAAIALVAGMLWAGLLNLLRRPPPATAADLVAPPA